MIKFFRKPRKEAITKKNVASYFFYALGEVVLVVIGILIAFALNNWNQQRKDHKEEIKMLQGLVQQLTEDVIMLRTNIEKTEKRRGKVAEILKLLDRPQDVNLNDFALLQLDLTENDYFISQRAIFDEAVSSGKLNLIKNDSLRQSIFQYYNIISNENDNDKLQYKITNEYIMPILVEEVSSTKEMMKIFSYTMGLQIDPNLEPLDFIALSRNRKYYQALIYAMSDSYQLKDWRRYSTLAARLKRRVEFELKDYGVSIEK